MIILLKGWIQSKRILTIKYYMIISLIGRIQRDLSLIILYLLIIYFTPEKLF